MKNGKLIRYIVMIILLSCLSFPAQASVFQDTFAFLESGQPVSFRFFPEAEKLPQFDADRTSSLNRMLRHLEIGGMISGNITEAFFTLDGDDLFGILEQETEESEKDLFVLLNNHSYAVSRETGHAETGANGIGQDAQHHSPFLWNLEIYHSLDAFREFFSTLPSAFPDHTSSARISEKYKGFGTAIRKLTIVIQGDDLNSYLKNHKRSGNQAKFYPDPSEIVFEGRQSFTLFFGSDDVLIRVRYSGRAGYDSGDIRSVRLDWKTLRSGETEKDELDLRTPNSKGTKRDNFLLTYMLKTEGEGSETFSWSAETDRVSDGTRTREFSKVSLHLQDHRIAGTLSELDTSRGKENATEILLDAAAEDGCSYSGTLEIIRKKDKIENEKWLFRFDLSKAVPGQSVSRISEMIPLDNVSPQDIQDRLTSAVVRRLMKLPSEDLSFLKDGIPENLWQEILQTGNN